MVIAKYGFGDSVLRYVRSRVGGADGAETVGLVLTPASCAVDEETLAADSLVQVAFVGELPMLDYASGSTLRNGVSTILSMTAQERIGDTVTTTLADGRGNVYVHTAAYDAATGVFAIRTEYRNESAETRVLQLLSSASLGGIAAPSRGYASTVGLSLHRMTSAWSRECRPKTDRFCDIGMDASWARYGLKVERFGARGTMPVKDWYPFAAIEDPADGFVLALKLEAPFSWQIELAQENDFCSLTAGCGDYDFARWRKRVPAGGSFCTHAAYVRVRAEGGVNGVCNDFLAFEDARLRVPPSEEAMPVLYNEYCATWGEPSEETVLRLADALGGFGVGTFVIDAGWFRPEGRNWSAAAGDWEQSKALFPHGIAHTVRALHQRGLRAGIWFEYEVAARESKAFSRTDLLLTREGAPLTGKTRRYFDLRLPAFKARFDEKVVAFLRDNGFDYLKVDYNDTIGFGCDGDDCGAPATDGEGGRQVAEESLALIDRLRAALPDLVIENCSSGGHRIEPLRMSRVAMCSCSDAHECAELPLVAANVARVVPARQNQIWASLREQDTPARIVYSLCAAMIGRICLSGDVDRLSEEQRALVREGLAFYRGVADIVRRGRIVRLDCTVDYYREPRGTQVFVREADGKLLVLFHRLDTREGVRVPVGRRVLRAAYSTVEARVEDGRLVLSEGEPFSAGAFLLE